MIRTDQHASIHKSGGDVVTKDWGESWGRRGERAPGPQVGRPTNAAQAHHDSHPGQKPQLLQQVRLAGGQLLPRRFVQGRGTAGGRGDVGVAQPEPIIAPLGDRAGGEPRLVEGAEQPRTTLISGEHSTGAVSAVGSRCQPHQQEPRARIAESGQGSGPIDVVGVAGRRLCSDGLAVRYEARTAPAPNDPRVEKRKGPAMRVPPRL